MAASTDQLIHWVPYNETNCKEQLVRRHIIVMTQPLEKQCGKSLDTVKIKNEDQTCIRDSSRIFYNMAWPIQSVLQLSSNPCTWFFFSSSLSWGEKRSLSTSVPWNGWRWVVMIGLWVLLISGAFTVSVLRIYIFPSAFPNFSIHFTPLRGDLVLGRHSYPLFCVLVRSSFCSSWHVAIYGYDLLSLSFSFVFRPDLFFS